MNPKKKNHKTKPKVKAKAKKETPFFTLLITANRNGQNVAIETFGNEVNVMHTLGALEYAKKQILEEHI